MSLITHQPAQPPALSDQVADEDIVEVNAFGQQTVVVPAGQRIPVDRLPKVKAQRPVEDKAAKAPRGKRRA